MNPVRYLSLRRALILMLCALVPGGCKRHPGDPVAAANDFFITMSQQHYAAAYQSAAVPMQARFSEAAFEAVARDSGLGTFVSLSWKTESATPKEARLLGQFVGKNNVATLLRATLVHESGRWKVYSLDVVSPQDPAKAVDLFARFDYGTGFNEVYTRKLPSDDEIRKLVNETIEKFNTCLHKKDFKAFYDYTSLLWQSRTTEAQVERAFKPYVDANQTLDFLKDVKVIFDEPPRLNADGYLLVDGYYPTTPRVIFHFQYTFELPKWKIVGITLSVEP